MKNKTKIIQIGIIGALLLYLYWLVFGWMIGQWEHNPNYTHGYLVLLACLYFIFRKRKLLKKIRPRPSLKGLGLIALGLVIYLIGARIEFMQVSLFSLVVIILGLIWFYQGRESLRELLFPVGFFIFAIPMPYSLEALTVPLKTMASISSTSILQALGFVVGREGNIIYMPGYTLEVATACSGLRSLVLVTAVGAFYAYMTQPTLGRKWALFGLSMPIAVISNIARIVIIGMLASWFGHEFTFKFVHDFSGIFVFIVAGILLALFGLLVGWLCSRRNLEQNPKS